MASKKLNRGFSQLGDKELDNKAETIIAALTANAAFPTPSPTLATIQTALDDFEAALAMPEGTAARAAAVKNTRTALEALLQQLAANLELTPSATDSDFATTGFDLPKQPSHTDAQVDAPGNVRLKATGTSRQVQVLCDSVTRAKSYEVQYSQDPSTGPWTDAGTFPNTRSIYISGLERAKDYWVRVRAVGPNGPGPWGDPATILVG